MLKEPSGGQRRRASVPGSRRKRETKKKQRRLKYAAEDAAKEATRFAAEQEELKKEQHRIEELRKELQQQAEQLQQERAAAGADVRTPVAAKRQCLSRVRRVMPHHPVHYVGTTLDLIHKVSPGKAKAFQKSLTWFTSIGGCCDGGSGNWLLSSQFYEHPKGACSHIELCEAAQVAKICCWTVRRKHETA